MPNKPIGQTFYINPSLSDAKGIFLRRVGLFFKRKGSQGCRIEIRETENGYPTRRRVPFGEASLSVSNISVSDDASSETLFTFETPVFLRSDENYALIIIPDGGIDDTANDNYQIFTSSFGILGENKSDLTTGVPVNKNNEVGVLFISSNDLTWSPNQNEDIKFNLYKANFTSNTGTAIFENPNEDYIHYKDITGNFATREYVFVSNNRFDLAKLELSGVATNWTNGEFIYQSNGSSNTATGIIYSGNSTVLLLQNTTGSFVVTNTVTGNTSGTTGTIDSANQTVTVSSSSNTVNMPFTDLITANDVIYVSENNFGTTKVVSVVTVANGTAITVNGLTLSSNLVWIKDTANTLPITFTDSAAVVGKIRGNGGLYAGLSTKIQIHPSDDTRGILDFVTSKTPITGNNNIISSVNFSNSEEQRLIGFTSGESANIISVYNPTYNSLTAQFESFNPDKTSITYQAQTVTNNASYDRSSWIDIIPNRATQFRDSEKIIFSKSNEYDSSIDSTSSIKVSMSSESSLISPTMDMARHNVTFTYNINPKETELEGYYINISNSSGSFTNNETVYIGNANTKTFNASGVAANGFIPITSNPFSNNDYITYIVDDGNTSITELVDGYNYYVVSSNSTGIYLSETEAGSVITLTAGSSETGHNINGVTLSGNAVYSNSTFIRIITPTGTGLQDRTVTGVTSGTTATAKKVIYFDESLDNGYYKTSRYISKNVVLADDQDAEDLRTYLAAYRPNGTNIFVYGKFHHREDPAKFDEKKWTKMVELNSPVIYSSLSNINDKIEIEYGIPSSVKLLTTDTTCNTTSYICTLDTTDGLSNNVFCYIKDNATGKMLVREIQQVVNNSTIILDELPTFASTNGEFGIISGLNTKESAFSYTENSGIIRYIDENDVVYDSYKTFAVKIVPISNTSYIIPTVSDMRSLALQV